ncbi:MAG TPA: hypothetical protein VKC66_20050 [Xanthobacteraceae bacterium]|nr:hypothetical protein [Xanthobacteraceae bacterium]
MPIFKLPLSLDMAQAVSPWTAFRSPIAIQMGFANVTIGQSSEPAVEADVLSDVASYGKQLGRIGDALIVLLGHFHPMTPLTEEETAAIADLKNMLEQIAAVKDKHNRQAMRPRAPVPLPALLAPEPVVMSPPSMPAATEPPAAATPPIASSALASTRRTARKSIPAGVARAGRSKRSRQDSRDRARDTAIDS